MRHLLGDPAAVKRSNCSIFTPIGIDCQLKYADRTEIHGIVFDLNSRASWAERPLLSYNLPERCAVFFAVVQSEFLAPFDLALNKLEPNTPDVLGLFEYQANGLRPVCGCFPSGPIVR